MDKPFAIALPQPAKIAINLLELAGFEAYVVGGCVRDSLLGKTPQDWDITTSALPEQTMEILKTYKIVETGLKHGTVTVFINSQPLEITTYRTEAGYSDFRRPDRVEFSQDLKTDLSRRDFTINAMAYSPTQGLIDCFGGQEDLKKQIIRCVGVAKDRFQEDPLRILRGLRFAGVLEFEIEEATKKAMLQAKNLLTHIAQERINVEFTGLLCSKNAKQILKNYVEIIGVFIPEVLPMVGFAQHNPHHIYDVFEHTLATIEAVEPTLVLRLTMFLHDIGKPKSFSMVFDVGHFYGHANLSEAMARDILHRLRYPKQEISQICTLVKYHDMQLEPDPYALKRWLNKQGAEFLQNLLKVKKADTMGQHPDYHQRIQGLVVMENMLDQVIAESECLSLKDLAINGKDLLAIGYKPDKSIGITLHALLDAVLREEIANQKDALTKRAQFYLRHSTYQKQ